jgi:hypothetical protein
VGFVVDRGRFSSSTSGFPCQLSFHQCLHHHKSPGVGTIGLLEAAVTSGPNWTPPPTIQIKKKITARSITGNFIFYFRMNCKSTFHFNNETILLHSTMSMIQVYRRFGGTYRFHLQSLRVTPAKKKQANSKQGAYLFAQSTYPSTLKMEAVLPFKTSVNICQTTRCHIQKYRIFHSHRCENLKSHTHSIVSLEGVQRSDVSRSRLFQSFRISV